VGKHVCKWSIIFEWMKQTRSDIDSRYLSPLINIFVKRIHQQKVRMWDN
jgi:hypothetical protein